MFRKLFLAISASILALFFVEFLLRAEFFPNRFFPEIGNHSPDPPKFSNFDRAFRILVLGDSFAAGSNSFPFFLESFLNSGKGAGKFEVINFGMSGIGPDKYLQYLQVRGRRYEPNLVLVNFYIGNDVRDVIRSESKPAFHRMAVRLFAGRSYLFHFLRQSAVNLIYCTTCIKNMTRMEEFSNETLRTRYQRIPESLRKMAHNLEANPFLLKTAVLKPGYVYENLFISTPELVGGWTKLSEILWETKREAGKINAKMVLVVSPDAAQVKSKYLDFYRSIGFRVSPAMLTTQYPQEKILGLAKKLRISVLNLLPIFRSRPDLETYLSYDNHWTKDGHKLAAQRILKFLMTEGPLR